MSDSPSPPAPTFSDLGLPAPLLAALNEVGYETPSPIQARTIPLLLAGRDVLGQAQTGTGKTAAFALPILARIDLAERAPQALVLTPTRELAIQVAEAFQKYAARLRDFHVLPIYGGQHYVPQLQALRRGPQVVVGTPGRIIDHMERGTLALDRLRHVVLDEADEMLRMGFIESVEKILERTPAGRQIALFSATMPAPIKRIAQTYLQSPAEITVRGKTSTVANTRQRYWLASGGVSKLDALTRILEAERFDAMIIFVRTKQETADLAGRLEARGFNDAPLSGDVDQKARERTVHRLKGGELDIIVATDVAARGLDVDRISHVVNYDVPYDTESYVHRIGRTGRAGRSGEAILFVMPRERHMLRIIERATRQSIAPMELPSADAVNEQRLAKLADHVTALLNNPELGATLQRYRAMLDAYQRAQGRTPNDVAAALAYIAQDEVPFMVEPAPPPPPRDDVRERGAKGGPRRETPGARARAAPAAGADRAASRPRRPPEAGMETFRLEVGHEHQVKPGNIVGAIANEAGIASRHIGRIDIYDGYSLVDLPVGMPEQILRKLRQTWVAGRPLRRSKHAGEAAAPSRSERPRARASTQRTRPVPKRPRKTG
jgi:ATP-dependent RNA helicase DeaD